MCKKIPLPFDQPLCIVAVLKVISIDDSFTDYWCKLFYSNCGQRLNSKRYYTPTNFAEKFGLANLYNG